jgi:hypothetical protein
MVVGHIGTRIQVVAARDSFAARDVTMMARAILRGSMAGFGRHIHMRKVSNTILSLSSPSLTGLHMPGTCSYCGVILPLHLACRLHFVRPGPTRPWQTPPLILIRPRYPFSSSETLKWVSRHFCRESLAIYLSNLQLYASLIINILSRHQSPHPR